MQPNYAQRYGNWALITGGNTGIGYELADQIAAGGCNIVLVARTKKSLDEASSKLTAKHGVNVRCIVADMSSQKGVEETIAAVKDLEIGMLVPNAGLEITGYFHEQDSDMIQKLLFVNVNAPTLLAHAFGRKMVARDKGAIILVASLLGFGAAPYYSVYAATKAYVISLGESLNSEFVPFGVHVTVLSPGATKTPMTADHDIASSGFKMGEASDAARAGLKALGVSSVAVPGFWNKVMLVLASRIFPRFVRSYTSRLMLGKMVSIKPSGEAKASAVKVVKTAAKKAE